MSELGDYGVTREFEDSIRRIIKNELARERPIPRYATVDSINTAGDFCMVTFNGDTASVKVFYRNTIPSYVGQVVAVEGIAPNQYIADTIGVNDTDVRVMALDGTVPFITPSLASGFTNDSFDQVGYRMVWDHGYKKIQLRGKVNISGTPSTIWTMPADLRPPINLAPILIAREFGGGSHVAIIDVLASGAINLSGGTVTPLAYNSSPTTASISTVESGYQDGGVGGGVSNPHGATRFTDFAVAGGTNHQHIVNGHGHTIGHTHTTTINHSHPVNFPTFISFNGVEYFI